MTDPFVLLGIPRKLGLEASEIDRLVRKASQQHHPDAGGDEELFKKIRLAGEVLKSPAKRIRAAIECEGLEFDKRGEIPEEVMENFSPVATVLQNVDGQINPTHSVSAGLDYTAIGPEHAYYRDQGRIEFAHAGDEDALDAFRKLACIEGILPALETSHGIAHALKRAAEMSKDKILCVNLSGRGDKDAMEAARLMGVEGLPKMTFS